MKIAPENFIKHFKRRKEAALEFVIDEYSGIVKAIIYNSLQSYNDLHVIEECISDTFLGQVAHHAGIGPSHVRHQPET